MRRLQRAGILGLIAGVLALVFGVGKAFWTGVFPPLGALLFVGVAVGLVAALLDVFLAGKPKTPPTAAAKAAPVSIQPAQTAIVFRQQMPPAHDPRHLNYFGGVPTLPASMAWPRWTHDGADEPLHFILQIDCAAVPAAARHPAFPARGVLAFFLDLRWGHSNGYRVVHAEGASAPLQAPADLAIAYGAEARHAWRWTAALDDPDRHCPRLLPKWPFDPVALAIPPALIEAWRAAAGGTEENPVFWWPDVEATHRALLEAQGDAPTVHKPERKASAPPYPGYPQDWRAIEIGAGLLLEQAKRKLRHAKSDPALRGLTDEARAAIATRIDAEARNWLARAAAPAPFDAVPEEVRDSFRSWLASWPDFALFMQKDAATFAIEAALVESAEAAARIPEEAIAQIRMRHVLAARTGSGLFAPTPDRMLAPPSSVQGDQEKTAQSHLLLLELSSNEGLGHHFGEGVYQFWITPDDLEARRFDRVKLTTTAY